MKKYKKHLLTLTISCILTSCTLSNDSSQTDSSDSVDGVSIIGASVNSSTVASENDSNTNNNNTLTANISEINSSSVTISTSISLIASDSLDSSSSSTGSGYYGNISTTATGATLRKQLYDLMIATHKTYTSYSGLSTAFKTTDANPNKSGEVLLFYTGQFRAFTGSFSGSINREHVWPNSKGVGKSGPGSDAHHLRPCDVTVNSNRGNLGYGTGGYIPNDSYKGIAARIIFYVGMHYGPDSTYKLQIVESVAGGNKSFGSLSVLLDWNRRFPVQDSEVRRNEAAQAIQGNRNPFIDEPDYACRIWGNESSAAKSACGY